MLGFTQSMVAVGKQIGKDTETVLYRLMSIQPGSLLFAALALALCGQVEQPLKDRLPRRIDIPVMAYHSRGTANLSSQDITLELDGRPVDAKDIEWSGPKRSLIRTNRSADDLVGNHPLFEGSPDPATVILLDTKNTPPEFQTWSVQQIALFLAHLQRHESIVCCS